MNSAAGALLPLVLGGVPALAEQPDPGEIQWEAESAYRDGDLRTARELANKAVLADSGATTAGARRLLVEIALRSGDLAGAQRAIDDYATRGAGLSADELGWIARARLRAQVCGAEQVDDIATASATLERLREERGAMRPTELAWLGWAEVRVDVRMKASFGQHQEALRTLERAGVVSGSPEQAWKAAMVWNLRLRAAEARCDWRAAEKAVTALTSSPEPSIETFRWASVGAARLGVRMAVAEGNFEQADRVLSDMLRQPGLLPDDRAWAQGYDAWLDRQIALAAGGDAHSSIVARASRWREMFPGETGCEAEGLASPWGEEAAPTVRWTGAAPSVQLGLVLGAGHWRDDEDDQGPHGNPAAGLLARTRWMPLSREGAHALGISAGLAGVALVDGYPMVDLWGGPAWGWGPGAVSLVGGGRTATLSRGYCDEDCPTSGNPERFIARTGYGGLNGDLALGPRLDLSLKVGLGGAPGQDIEWSAHAELGCAYEPFQDLPFTVGLNGWRSRVRSGRSSEAEELDLIGSDQEERHVSTETWVAASFGVRWGREVEER